MAEVIEISRERFDHRNQDDFKFKADPGITREIVELISHSKKEPAWMLQKRLKCFEIFQSLHLPTWGPDISTLDLSKITFYAEPNAMTNARSWDEVPAEIKRTFDKLGIPEAERKALAGVGAQYESINVYHNIKKELKDQGVIFEDFDYAVQHYPDLVKKYFMTKCVPPTLHKY